MLSGRGKSSEAEHFTDGALVCLPVCGDYQSINFILCPEANMCHILKGNLDMSARVINCKNIKTELSFTVSFT